MLPNSSANQFCDVFSDIGQFFRPGQTKSFENQNSDHVSKILDKIGKKIGKSSNKKNKV